MKSDTQHYAVSPPNEALPLGVATRQRQVLILETQPRTGSCSPPFKESHGRISCSDFGSLRC